MSLVDKLVGLQYKYRVSMLVFFLVVLVVLGYGITKVGFDSDFEAQMPQQLEVYQVEDKIAGEFNGDNVLFVILEAEGNNVGEEVDVRKKEVVDFLGALEERLSTEPKVNQVFSVASVLNNKNIEADADVKLYDDKSPVVSSFFSRNKKVTYMYIQGDVSRVYNEVKSFENMVEDKVDAIGVPGGVEMTITGTPSITKTVYEYLRKDSVFTLALAIVIIFFMLLLLERSLAKTVIIMVPLGFGLVWTIGTLGWLGIKISIATAGLGAIVVGLGVEYGVFMAERFKEERMNYSEYEALRRTVNSVGKSIIGSGGTTIVGFLSLAFSIMPMMQNLGISLALGIFYCLLAAVVVTPVVILFEEYIEAKLRRAISVGK